MDIGSISGTHPVQVLCIAILFATNTVVLAYLNERKRLEQAGKLPRKVYSWPFKRGCYWALILCALAVEIYLDTQYDIDVYFVHLKGYTFSWSVCLLDLYFSSTPAGVPMTCIMGILSWVFTGMSWRLESATFYVRKQKINVRSFCSLRDGVLRGELLGKPCGVRTD